MPYADEIPHHPQAAVRGPGKGADAIKEKFLNQRSLNAQVKMPPKHARAEQGHALHAQRDNKSIREARA